MNPPGADGTEKPRWSSANSPLVYTPAEVQALAPIRASIEKQAAIVDPPARRSFTFAISRVPFSDFFTIHLVDPKTGQPNGQTEELSVDETSEWFRVRGADMKTLEKALDHIWNFYKGAVEITNYVDPPIKNPHLQPRID